VNVRSTVSAAALVVGLVGAVVGLLLMSSDDFDTFQAGTVVMIAGIAMMFGTVIYRMATDDPDVRWSVQPRQRPEPAGNPSAAGSVSAPQT
jgi:hypothetical protein